MFLLLLISISVLIAVLIQFLIIKNKTGFILPFWMLFLSVIATISGIGLINWQQTEITIAMEQRNWHETTATVLESKVAGDRAYHPEITYEYFADGQKFKGITDLNVPGFGGKNYRKNNASKIINEMPAGTELKVYYDPDNPQISVLHKGPKWSNYMQSGFAVIILSIGLLGIIYGIRQKLNI